jgi:DNA-binding transcriptional ArsR family regulator
MEQQQTVEVLKALADETRLSIVRKLAVQPVAVSSCDIVESCASFLSLSQPAMSHHFGKLVTAGVLREEKQGTKKAYRLNDALLTSIGVDVTKL